MKSFLKYALVLSLFSQATYARESKFYCQEDHVADAPSWILKFDGDRAILKGTIWMVDSGNDRKITLKQTSYLNQFRKPIGFFTGPHPLNPKLQLKLSITGIDVINSSRKSTSYSGMLTTEPSPGSSWDSSDYQESPIHCAGPKMRKSF